MDLSISQRNPSSGNSYFCYSNRDVEIWDFYVKIRSHTRPVNLKLETT